MKKFILPLAAIGIMTFSVFTSFASTSNNVINGGEVNSLMRGNGSGHVTGSTVANGIWDWSLDSSYCRSSYYHSSYYPKASAYNNTYSHYPNYKSPGETCVATCKADPWSVDYVAWDYKK